MLHFVGHPVEPGRETLEMAAGVLVHLDQQVRAGQRMEHLALAAKRAAQRRDAPAHGNDCPQHPAGRSAVQDMLVQPVVEFLDPGDRGQECVEMPVEQAGEQNGVRKQPDHRLGLVLLAERGKERGLAPVQADQPLFRHGKACPGLHVPLGRKFERQGEKPGILFDGRRRIAVQCRQQGLEGAGIAAQQGGQTRGQVWAGVFGIDPDQLGLGNRGGVYRVGRDLVVMAAGIVEPGADLASDGLRDGLRGGRRAGLRGLSSLRHRAAAPRRTMRRG